MARLAYILAASHSGSTLLAMLLGTHRDVFTAGELKATNLGDPLRYCCSCGQLIGACPFWDRVKAAMARRGFEFDITSAGTNVLDTDSAYARFLLRPLHRRPLLEALRDAALALSPRWSRSLASSQARNTALIESLLELSGARLVIDSSKIDLRLKYLLRNRALDVRVLRLVRDGRAVALTYMHPLDFADAHRPELRNGGSGASGARHRLRALSMAEAARTWRRSNEAAECLLSGLPRSRWIEVRYEELCASTESTLDRLCRFLSIDPGGVVPDFRAVESHVLGNGMRLDTSSEVRLDERWREHLSPGDLTTFDTVAGAVNKRYGYS